MQKVVSVPQNSTATLGSVEGDLHVGEGSTIKAEEGLERITVSGFVRCEGDCSFECGLTAESLDGRDGNILIRGDLSVSASIRIREGELHVAGNLLAKTMDVDKRVIVGKDLSVEKIDVGGSLEVAGITKALDLDVGGSYKASGSLKAIRKFIQFTPEYKEPSRTDAG